MVLNFGVNHKHLENCSSSRSLGSPPRDSDIWSENLHHLTFSQQPVSPRKMDLQVVATM